MKMIKYLAFGSAIVIALMGLTIYYLRSENETLLTNNATLNSSILTLKHTVMDQNGTIKKITRQRYDDQITSDVQAEELSKLREEAEKAKEVFKKHDLGNLTLKKPKLIESVINKGTAKVGKVLEELTK